LPALKRRCLQRRLANVARSTIVPDDECARGAR
jgi:hypothetical protein